MSDQYSALSAEALLLGFAKCGLDVVSIRTNAGLRASAYSSDDSLPLESWHLLWKAASQQDGRKELPTLAGLHVPFGAFGMIDYLAGSSETIEGAVYSLSDHFAAVASSFALEISKTENNDLQVLIANRAGFVSYENDEFTLAAFVGHFRHLTANRFSPTVLSLTRNKLSNSNHSNLLGCSIHFEVTQASMVISEEESHRVLSSSDPQLHETLLHLAKKLDLNDGDMKATKLQIAIRSRLRNLLPQGKVNAGVVAKALGLSERTLHRKLAEQGTSYQDTLDQFRTAEAERLILGGRHEFSQIALNLGFADQSSWSRAFKRAKGVSPLEWSDPICLPAKEGLPQSRRQKLK